MAARRRPRPAQLAQPALAAAAKISDLRLIRTALRAAGCRVRSASTPAQALRLAPRERDGVIVLSFPNETFAVARRLRAHSGATLIVFTDRANCAFREAAAEAGVDAYVEEARAESALPALLSLFARATLVRPAKLDPVQQQYGREET
jgi:DNA-binding response OmpR family regulator